MFFLYVRVYCFAVFCVVCFSGFSLLCCSVFPSVLWDCWLGFCSPLKLSPSPDNLYCVGGDVKPCSINQSGRMAKGMYQVFVYVNVSRLWASVSTVLSVTWRICVLHTARVSNVLTTSPSRSLVHRQRFTVCLTSYRTQTNLHRGKADSIWDSAAAEWSLWNPGTTLPTPTVWT